MRSAAISPHDVATIIHALAHEGSWEGTRSGYRIRLIRFPVEKGKQRIEYAYKAPGCREWKASDALTVFAALTCINHQIAITPTVCREANMRTVEVESQADGAVVARLFS